MTDDSSPTGCCAPSRPSTDGVDQPQDVPSRSTAAPDHSLVAIPSGRFTMGTDEEYRWQGDGESPAREIELSEFLIAPYTVSNREFSAFIEDSGHVTDAERFEWSFVFHSFLPDGFPDTRGVAAAPWWRQVFGADWAHPAGPQSDLTDLLDHPVVHVSWNDAVAYCQWAGVRLPTEAEWERAARGGLESRRFAWGDELTPDGATMCNIWQGQFPVENTAEDGYVGTAPVDAFPPNGFGLFNVAGNVWEWCADWFHSEFHRTGPTVDPPGPPAGEAHVIRGGSYLCHDSYCDRYRVSARSSNAADSSTGNMGFRVAASPPSA